MAVGGSLSGRPELAEAMNAIHAGEASALVVAKLDRLSRSVHDFSGLLERARREGWGLVVVDLGADTMTPAGELIANVTASTSQYERRMIGLRTREALTVKKAQGVRLGRPPTISASTRVRIVREREQGAGWTAIADALNCGNVPTSRGGSRWFPSTVRVVIASSAPALLARRSART